MKKIIDFLYVITFTKFYFNYLLITNPVSKNILIRFVYGGFKKDYGIKNKKSRCELSYMLIIVHSILFVFLFYIDTYISITNILVNFYPMLVNLYIAYRLRIIIKYYEKRRQINM
jgi:hypothetical protein